MSSLDELKKQRELVQQHLTWLDQQIAGQLSESPVEGETSPQPAREKLTLAAPDATKAPTSTPRPETRQPFPEISKSNELSNGVQPSQVHGDIAKAKVGCVVIFIAAVSLFLFLLFGLPYLIDNSNETQTGEESIESVKETE